MRHAHSMLSMCWLVQNQSIHAHVLQAERRCGFQLRHSPGRTSHLSAEPTLTLRVAPHSPNANSRDTISLDGHTMGLALTRRHASHAPIPIPLDSSPPDPGSAFGVPRARASSPPFRRACPSIPSVLPSPADGAVSAGICGSSSPTAVAVSRIRPDVSAAAVT
eukprot:CAMPEP_0181200416 /NCGR_PEP_ID=MMETSP1096-20121128/17749_1 /TAXON_ID=156174 ORGANISM="Chrysochromulina ericina, Strain CCMP281" /NCGR_SAMPLE_ID=MMETSP1096 /ASSEMBLY_ACC=CAM_ASM_000453 /LENGTH=162 /DNA_ID=CAMNT_0023290765 /DNA_START=125 /DNA_END=613 /DNA_ORIENTATION=+